jgi:DNA-binding response OmpR family regulator
VTNVKTEVSPHYTHAVTGSTMPTILVAVGEAPDGDRLARELGGEYQVLLARDGLDAVVQYERLAGQVSAVVADARLPRLSGGVLAEWLHHIDTQLPVIIMADGDEEDELTPLRGLPAVRIVTKPVGIRRLKALVEASGQARKD